MVSSSTIPNIMPILSRDFIMSKFGTKLRNSPLCSAKSVKIRAERQIENAEATVLLSGFGGRNA
jgi:hypothetical protein